MSDAEKYMKRAIELAQQAALEGEVPVGAVIVKDNKIIAEAYNKKEQNQCCTQHAEVLAIEQASKDLNSWRLTDCELYVTLEPCVMCTGAIQQSRFKKLVFGCSDPKGGAVSSLYEILTDSRLNHTVVVETNLLSKECSQLLRSFFKSRRASSNKTLCHKPLFTS